MRRFLPRPLRRAPGWLLWAALLQGCASPPPADSPETSEEAPAPRAQRLPLQDHLPTPGLRYLVALRPQRLVADEILREAWLPLLSAERLEAYSHASGIDPTRIDEAWIAGYDMGHLFLLDGSQVGDAVEEAFRKRALTTRDVPLDEVDLRLVTGMVEGKPHALVHVTDHLVAIAEGDIGLARIVAAYARGKLDETPSALRSKTLAPHRDFADDAPVRAWFRGPFLEATDVVVQATSDGVVGIWPRRNDLVIEARVRGAWPPLLDLSDRLQTWTDQMLETPQLRALGWSEPRVKPKISCEERNEARPLTQCSATGTWDSERIARSLYRIVAAPSSEMFEGPERSLPSSEGSPSRTNDDVR